jgi:hypothetical protein
MQSVVGYILTVTLSLGLSSQGTGVDYCTCVWRCCVQVAEGDALSGFEQPGALNTFESCRTVYLVGALGV